jgi:hypothetical protein
VGSSEGCIRECNKLRKNQYLRVKFLQLMQEFDTIQRQKAIAESEVWKHEARITEAVVMTTSVRVKAISERKLVFKCSYISWET